MVAALVAVSDGRIMSIGSIGEVVVLVGYGVLVAVYLRFWLPPRR